MIKDKFREVQKVLWIILFLNIAVATAKIIMGAITNSTSMTADGYHSLADGSSNIIGLIGIWFAAKPVDEKHPYGHRKFEILASLFIVGMLVYLALRIISEAYANFRNPLIPDITTESLVVMLLTLVINIFVAKFEYRKGQRLNSTILVSDSMHTKSDIYVTIGVLTTLIAIRLGAPPIVDSVTSLFVAGFILHAAYEIFKDASVILVDSAVVDTKDIENITLCHEGVKGIHKIRSRGTADDLHIDMHILADPHLTLEESHKLVHEIEDKLREKINNNIQVIIHLEPMYGSLANNDLE